jgi:hypothetical protein
VRISRKSVTENVFTITWNVFAFTRQGLIPCSKARTDFGERPSCKTKLSEIVSTLLNLEPRIRMRGDLPPCPITTSRCPNF